MGREDGVMPRRRRRNSGPMIIRLTVSSRFFPVDGIVRVEADAPSVKPGNPRSASAGIREKS